MTPISFEPLSRIIERCIRDVGKIADDETVAIKPDQLERFARAISSHLKVLREVEDYNFHAAQKDENEKYTRYEDLPAPNLEERARLIARIRNLYDHVNAGDKIQKTN